MGKVNRKWLQAYVNDPARGRDIDDIRGLLHNNADTLDMARVRHYFSIFDRESLLDDLLSQTGAQGR